MLKSTRKVRIACLVVVFVQFAGAQSVKELTDSLIDQHRKGTLRILLPGPATVSVTQIRHDFPFGTCVNRRLFGLDNSTSTPEDMQKYQDTLRAYFNAATHENALKWHHTEKNGPGDPGYVFADSVYRFCAENNLAMRGHLLVWEDTRYMAQWVKELNDDDLRFHVKRRVKDVTTHYKGKISDYDLNNEMLEHNYIRTRLGDGIVKEMADAALEGDPDAVLYLNEYNILDGAKLTAYLNQIRHYLAQEVPIGGIGCQGHFWSPVPSYHVLRERLDSLAQFGLPIKITEYDYEAAIDARASGLDRAYRTFFSHPAVTGITMWGFWAGRMWRSGAAFWELDWTPNKAAQAYKNLVYHEWWTREEQTANDSGVCEIRVFFGTHAVEVGDKTFEVTFPQSHGSEYTLDLRPTDVGSLRAPHPSNESRLGTTRVVPAWSLHQWNNHDRRIYDIRGRNIESNRAAPVSTPALSASVLVIR